MGILQEATPEAVKLARRHFPEARREDFLVEGRDWTDKATGLRYRVARYDPLQSLDPKQSNVSMFVVSDSKLVFLQRQAQRTTFSGSSSAWWARGR